MSTTDNQATAGAALVGDVIHPDVLVIRILGLANGGPHALAGKWLKEYDPKRPGRAHIVCTEDPFKARRFNNPIEAHDCWTAESGRPYPADKPLTAFTIEILPLSDYTPGDPRP